MGVKTDPGAISYLEEGSRGGGARKGIWIRAIW